MQYLGLNENIHQMIFTRKVNQISAKPVNSGPSSTLFTTNAPIERTPFLLHSHNSSTTADFSQQLYRTSFTLIKTIIASSSDTSFGFWLLFFYQ